MAWAGSTSYRMAKNGVFAVSSGFDADAENTGAIDILDKFKFIPNKWSIVVARTGGTTDVIDADLDISDDAASWETIATLTSSSTPVQTTVVDKVGRYVRIIVNTVGAGNTLKFSWTAIY